MKSSELRQKSKAELNKILKEKKEELRQFYFDLASGKVKNIRTVRKDKKDIARILTILSGINSDKINPKSQTTNPK